MFFRRHSVFAVGCLVGFATVLNAQSTQMHRPTRVTSIETTARFRGPLVHYYAFEAGPGKFTLFTAAQLTDGGNVDAGNIRFKERPGDIWFRVRDGTRQIK